MVAARRRAALFACLLAAGALAGGLLAGCGGDSDSSTGSGGKGPDVVESRPAPPKSAFPDPQGLTLKQVLKLADAPAEIILAPGAQVFYAGENRYPLGITSRDHAPISDAEVAIYYAKVPTFKAGTRSRRGNKGLAAKAESQALDQPAIGPFPAKVESLGTEPEFRAETTADDRDAATVVYSAQVPFPSDGEYRPAVMIKIGDEITAKLLPSAEVGEYTRIPRVGEQAPRIHTPTAEDVGGDLSKLTTRVPPEQMNKVDYADALGREPIVLLFATPQFCQSRVCGPVVDVTEEARQRFGDEAAFIHMEIYNDNDPGRHVRPQVRDFSLPTEPWLFTIDREGTVSAAVEGPFGAELLGEAIEKALRG